MRHGSARDMGDYGGGELDIGQLGRAIRRNGLWIVLPTLVALAVSSFLVNALAPRYTADSRVLLAPGDSYYTRPNGSADIGVPADERDVASQVQLVMSRDLAKQAVARLQLRGNPEFDDNAGFSGMTRQILAFLGVIRDTDADRVLDKFSERVMAYPAGQSRVLAIEFTSGDPQLAARGANIIAEIYLEMQEDAKKQAARAAGTWLLNTIDPLRQKVLDAEAKVEAFRARTGILLGSNNTTIQQQQLGDVNTQLGAARSAQAESQAKARLLRDALAAGRTLEISEVANNDLVRKLAGERTTLKAQLALESRSLLPGHPRIKELVAQLNDVEAQIRTAAEKAVRTLENDSRIAGSRVESLLATLDTIKRQSTTASESEVELRALEREAKTQREQLEAMLTRYREAMARDAKNAIPPDARIVSRADAPTTPSFPKKLPIILISTLATLFLAVTIVVSRELLSGRAYVPVAGPAAAASTDAPGPAETHPAVALVPAESGPPQEAAAQSPVTSFSHRVTPEPPQQDSPPKRSEPAQRPEIESGAALPSWTPVADLEPVLPASPASDIVPAGDLDAAIPVSAMAASSQPSSPLAGGRAVAGLMDESMPAAAASHPAFAQPHPRHARGQRPADLAGLAQALQGLGPTGRGQRVLVTAVQPFRGADFGYALGRVLAKAQRAVMVEVDADPERERLRAGLGELIRGEASFMQVIERDPGSRLHLVSGGYLDPAVLAGTPEHLTPVLVALEQTYDLVLLACPALGESALGLAIAPSVDAVVLIDDGSDPDASDAAADALGAATPAPVLVSGPLTHAAATAA